MRQAQVIEELERNFERLIGSLATTGRLDADLLTDARAAVARLAVVCRDRDEVPRRPMAWVLGAVGIIYNRSLEYTGQAQEQLQTAMCELMDDLLACFEDRG